MDVVNRGTEARSWLLRLMNATWDIHTLKVGQRVWFGAKTGAGNDRQEYGLFKVIRKSDRVLGLATGDFQAIVCEFEVDETLHVDPNHGEIIWLTIVSLYFPYIPLSRNSVYWYSDQGFTGRNNRLFEIDEQFFNGVRATDLDFPKLVLTDTEKKYLEILYANFIEGTEIISSYALPEIWNDELPKSFRPEQMDQELVGSGRDITLMAICQIHPESELFFRFEQAIFIIQAILRDGKGRRQITVGELIQQLSGSTRKEIFQIFKLLSRFREIFMGFEKTPSGTENLMVNSNEVYEGYRQYSGLRKLMADHLAKNPIKNKAVAKRYSSSSLDLVSANEIFRTNGLRRSRADFTPVLGVQSLAEQLANLVYHLPPDSQMVGLFGKWGRGKTFLLDQLWAYMDKTWENRFIKVVYHAWKYQETPASWAYLYEQFADTYLGKKLLRRYPIYFWRLLRLNLRRLDIQPIVTLGLSTVALIAWIIISPRLLHDWHKYIGSDIAATIGLSLIFRAFKKEISPKATELIKKYSLRHSFKATMGLQADIQDELIKLLNVWIPTRPRKFSWKFWQKAGSDIQPKQRIFLVVEDMDRCKEDRIIENIDALRVLLEDPEISSRLIILTAIDERILKSAIRKKYAQLVAGGQDKNKPAQIADIELNDLISEYLDKLFIAAIKLGDLSYEQRAEFLKELIKNDVSTSVDVEDRLGKVAGGSSETGTSDRRMPPHIHSEEDGRPVLISVGEGEHVKLYNVGISHNDDAETGWKGLSKIEVESLDKMIKSWETATPRRIAIFYHRYLLCKNTLIGKYLQLGRPNAWQDAEGIQTILQLLRYYGECGNSEAVVLHKANAQGERGETTNVAKVHNVVKPTVDYLCLVEVLELVVAY